MTLEQAIFIESEKAREWREYRLPDGGDNIHALYAEWFEQLKCLLKAWEEVKADIRLFIDAQKTQTVCPTDKRDALAVDCLKVMSISTAEACLDIINKHLKEVRA